MNRISRTPAARLAQLQSDILAQSGWNAANPARVLDVGCGNGDAVDAWLALGHDVYGCDFKFKPGNHAERLLGQDRICLIEGNAPYRLPYPDAHFDLLLSNQVMEHVKDYPATLGEMRRVLRPGGMCLHLFPSRWRPLEPHVGVPLATVLQDRTWLSLWAMLGVRTAKQKDLGWRATVEANYEYLRRSTNYLTGNSIVRNFRRHFDEVRFADDAFLRNSPNARGRMLHKLTQFLPPLLWLYRFAWTRVVLAK